MAGDGEQDALQADDARDLGRETAAATMQGGHADKAGHESQRRITF